MIVRVNGSYYFKLENSIHMCGKKDDTHLEYGLPMKISNSFFQYIDQPGGVIPISEVRKLGRFLSSYLKKYDSKEARKKYYKLSEHTRIV